MHRVRDRIRNPEDDPAGWTAALDDANVPDKYRGATVEAITAAPQVRQWLATILPVAHDWLGRGIGFYLHGPLNAGKSSVAAILLMEAVRRCERALWLPVRDVPKARFREGDRGAWLDDRLQRCDLLVLDDLGSERFRLESAAGPTLEETVRIAYDRDRTVIITSNMGWTEFTTRSEYARRAEPFVSVVRRRCHPVEVNNNQWPLSPPGQDR